MAERVKPVGVTIDKLTVLADLEVDYDDFYKQIESLGFELQDYQSKKYGYSFVYKHNDNGGYIEIARQKVDYDVKDLERRRDQLWGLIISIKKGDVSEAGETLDELNERLEGILEILSEVDERGHLKRLKDVRYELNPKYFDYTKTAEASFFKVMSMLKMDTLRISSIHIAIDYPIALNSITIKDIKSRKEVIYKGTNKKVQTMYFGGKASRSHLAIYDKKNENVENESIDQYPDYQEITRFEARLRNNYAREFFTSDFNPFEGLIISQDFMEAVNADPDLNENEAAKLMMYFNFPERLHSKSPATRYRFRNLMKKFRSLTINVTEDYAEEKNSLVRELESWFKSLSKESIPDKK